MAKGDRDKLVLKLAKEAAKALAKAMKASNKANKGKKWNDGNK